MPCLRWLSRNLRFLPRSPVVQSAFAPVLWVLFVTTGVFTLAITMAIRLWFRRGKSITDL